MKSYQTYDAGLEKKRRGFYTTIFRLLVQILLVLVILFFAVLLVFRWAPIPTSAFIFQQNHLAKNAPKIYEKAAYEWINWDDISPQLAIAVIASEDQRFPTHWGIDTIEIRKALDNIGEKSPRGASTITQQVAKNLFLWGGRSYTRKILEAAMSVSIEMVWPKKRILEVYMNIAQFGDATFGAKQASEQFFDLEAKKLSREQAAMLAAVLPKPAISDVNDPRPALQKRQQWILKQMKQLGGLNYLKQLK
ncbi:MAG: monofunctional biosynthetic peptidoglycan transglycosylase [Cocleimonas sp.]